ncbi:hypothetical protein Taro_022909, partial [Colocasia esculenta]|nr:hypothetical protein [Colocasia esculenta]
TRGAASLSFPGAARVHVSSTLALAQQHHRVQLLLLDRSSVLSSSPTLLRLLPSLGATASTLPWPRRTSSAQLTPHPISLSPLPPHFTSPSLPPNPSVDGARLSSLPPAPLLLPRPQMEMGTAAVAKCSSPLRPGLCYASPSSWSPRFLAPGFSRRRLCTLALAPPTAPGRQLRAARLRCSGGSGCDAVDVETDGGREGVEIEEESADAVLYCVSPLPLLLVAALPGGDTIRSVFGPFVELVKSWNLPDWLVHWGHPGNMAVVLFAMGGYGTYLGFRIRFSDDVEEKAMAKDLHPKLLGGMFFFFALGATGGITSLLTSDKPILESPHAVTGVIGLTLLTIQTILPSLFEGNPGVRNVHGILGSGIMALFLVHAALGLQLGLSY